MEIAFLLIPLAVLLVFVILGGFWWAIHTGQFEDLEEEGSRILEQD
ncbi:MULTISPECIES: cbb3-type cytochrome oxidase assembly protein CcoS [unclassified Methylophilus]|jgi:cbb3-type cytochrome oxidase maturation protein|nr:MULTISPECIES: cbb3-type cytochrome oxidase assembly protein CcoS [unclassified Methylophilus]KQT37743.1 cytochrome oxidase [Methylophilus sp. Leaf414]KQT43481.1 cytochrome oxidase [Methylophilus sp. Leaf416]KQT58967.1 cytochrome oxidase [Methylophilus sp. Leaf459]HSI46052.1 cbb3-type cytochrome oxidase assembly protein CcoS [Methylophilus sp.]